MAPASRPSPLHVFYDKETGMWSSPNAPALRTPVPPPIKVHTETPIKFFAKPQWMNPSFPYLAFWPVHHPSSIFSGPLFHRLDITSDSLPIVTHSEAKFSLSQELITSWERLETALYDLVLFLLERCLGTSKIPIVFLYLPHECGYKSFHSQMSSVRSCGFKSREAFKGLMAASSFAIALNTTPEDANRVEPEWVVACRRNGIHPQWLDDLRRTIVCDFAPGMRSGAYIDGYQAVWKHHFPAFARALVPLWISWGPEPKKASSIYFPTQEEARAAYRTGSSFPVPLGRESPTTTLLTSQSHQLPPPASTAQPSLSVHEPEVHPGSRQRSSETMDQFRSRMVIEAIEYQQNEHQDDRGERLARESQAFREANDSTRLKPSFGTALYQWVKQPGGSTLRTLVTPSEWSHRWRRLAGSQKHYYSFLDEWDLDPAPSARDGDDCSNSDEFSSLVIAGEARAKPKRAPLTGVQVVADPFESPVSVFRADVPITTVVCLTLSRVLQFRYGYIVVEPYHTHPLMTFYNKRAAGLQAVTRAGMLPLGLKGYENEELARAAVDLYNFTIGNFDASDRPRPSAFPPVWDFDPAFRNTIMAHPKYQYHRVGESLHLIGVTGTPLHKQWYILGLHDACDVLHIFRDVLNTPEGSPDSFHAIIRTLISYGIQFSTLKCLPEAPPEPRARRRRLGLGYRPKDHKFDVLEYRAYEQAKRDVLTSSIGRAALMRGGIVWRLSQDIVNPKAVTGGVPGSSLRNHGILAAKWDGHYLVDEFLHEEDEDIICGVYYVYTGSGVDQVSQRSWWPKTSVWRLCGLNIGYWSIDCEAWYQRRLQEIRSGQAVPYTSSDWRGKLKYKSSYTGRFTGYMSVLSDMLLAGDERHWN